MKIHVKDNYHGNTSSIHPREFTMSKNMVGEKYYSNADKKSVKM